MGEIADQDVLAVNHHRHVLQADQGNLDAQVYLGVKYNKTVRDQEEQEDVRDLA